MTSIGNVTELKKEIDDLHAHNEQVESTIEELYLEKQRYQFSLRNVEILNCLYSEKKNEFNNFRMASPMQITSEKKMKFLFSKVN